MLPGTNVHGHATGDGLRAHRKDRFKEVVGVLHVLAPVGQSDPQASGLGGLIGFLKFLNFLRFFSFLIHHPVAGLTLLSLGFAFGYAVIAARKGRSKLKRPPERESSPGDAQKKVE
jgi:hypothetical protein